MTFSLAEMQGVLARQESSPVLSPPEHELLHMLISTLERFQHTANSFHVLCVELDATKTFSMSPEAEQFQEEGVIVWLTHLLSTLERTSAILGAAWEDFRRIIHELRTQMDSTSTVLLQRRECLHVDDLDSMSQESIRIRHMQVDAVEKMAELPYSFCPYRQPYS